MPQAARYLSTDPNAGSSPTQRYLSTDPNAGQTPDQERYLSTDPDAGRPDPLLGPEAPVIASRAGADVPLASPPSMQIPLEQLRAQRESQPMNANTLRVDLPGVQAPAELPAVLRPRPAPPSVAEMFRPAVHVLGRAAERVAPGADAPPTMESTLAGIGGGVLEVAGRPARAIAGFAQDPNPMRVIENLTGQRADTWRDTLQNFGTSEETADALGTALDVTVDPVGIPLRTAKTIAAGIGAAGFGAARFLNRGLKSAKTVDATTDKFALLREAQNAKPAPTFSPSALTAALRRDLVNRYEPGSDFMRAGGLNPDTLPVAENPAKLTDLAHGGLAGKVEDLHRTYKEAWDEAIAAGADPAQLQDLLNLNASEHGADILTSRAQTTAAEQALRTDAARLGREPQQPVLPGTVPEGPTPAPEPRAPGATKPGIVSTQQTARGVADQPGQTRTQVGAGDPRAQQVRIPRGVTRRDTVAMVPDITTTPRSGPRGPEYRQRVLDDSGAGQPGLSVEQRPDPMTEGQTRTHVVYRGPDGKPVVTAILQTVEEGPDAGKLSVGNMASDTSKGMLTGRAVAAVGAKLKEMDAARPYAGISPDAERLITKAAQPPTPREPRQPLLEGAPSPSEVAAVNAAIDRATLGTIKTTVEKPTTPRKGLTEIDALAAETGVDSETAKAFVRVGEKRRLPDTFVEGELRQAKRRSEQVAASAVDPGLEAGKKLPMTLNPSDLRAKRAALEAEMGTGTSEVKDGARKVFDLNRGALDLSYKGGLLTDERYRVLAKESDEAYAAGRSEYVPLSRMQEEIEKSFKTGGINLPQQHYLYRLQGSEKTSDHPMTASVERAAVALSEVERNKAVKAWVDLRHRGGFFADNILPLKGDAKPPAGFDTLTYLEKGVPKKFAVPAPLAHALKGLDGESADFLTEAMGKGSFLFRGGTTAWNFGFTVPNVIRDVSDLRQLDSGTSALSKAVPGKAWGEWFTALEKVWHEKPEYRAFHQAGAGYSNQQKAQLGYWDHGSKIPKWLNPAAINNAMEEATKLAAYTIRRRRGMSELDAAWETRRFGGSPDFARRGAKMRQFNALIPFLNAQTQGLARTLTWMQQNPKQAAAGAVAITGKILALQMYNNSYVDPDGTPSWNRISERERATNFIIFTPGTFEQDGVQRQNYIKIPAGHAVNLVRAPIQAIIEPNRSGGQVVDSLLQSLPMSPQGSVQNTLIAAANPVLRVPVEHFANRQAFFDQPITPRRLESVAPEERTTARTSELAKVVGQSTGWSPLVIDHYVRGFGGGVADQILSGIDAAVGQPKPGAKGVPVVGQIAGRFWGAASGAPDQQAKDWGERFYDALDRANQARATVNLLKTEGNTARIKALQNQPHFVRDYALASDLNAVSTRLAAVRKRGDRRAEMEILKRANAALDRVEGR